jgi:hypothetical protein
MHILLISIIIIIIIIIHDNIRNQGLAGGRRLVANLREFLGGPSSNLAASLEYPYWQSGVRGSEIGKNFTLLSIKNSNCR